MVGRAGGDPGVSAAEGEEHKHEIIIVRRGHGDHDDGHHGGVWKIAFADFMTAMMCFFLVMWLINAANEETRAAVASYFNPVKLIDRNSSKKGLEDIGDGPNSAGMTGDEPTKTEDDGAAEGSGNSGPASAKNASESAAVEGHSDQHLFADPYAVLAEIATDTGIMQNVSAKGEGGAQLSGPSTGASGGESYRDPFAPDFWSQQVAATDTAEAGPEKSERDSATQVLDGKHPAEAKDAATAAVEAAHQASGRAPKPEAAGEPAAEERQPEEAKPSAETIKAADAIRKELAEVFKPGEKLAEGLTVVATDKGVTISVTDQLDFGMYEIGSAVPRREMVLAMERIGKVLGERRGKLTVSGHTDARPFKNESYDNWRLSTARAHSAYYMLVRTGLDERRITEIAGYADRKLKDATDSFNASNRRIEILLEVGE
jgi:chemotaxis protein MotB